MLTTSPHSETNRLLCWGRAEAPQLFSATSQSVIPRIALGQFGISGFRPSQLYALILQNMDKRIKNEFSSSLNFTWCNFTSTNVFFSTETQLIHDRNKTIWQVADRKVGFHQSPRMFGFRSGCLAQSTGANGVSLGSRSLADLQISRYI